MARIVKTLGIIAIVALLLSGEAVVPVAVIRNGDYPRERSALDITVVLSQLSDVEKVRKYYNKSASFIQETKRKQEEVESKLRKLEEASKAVPSLF